jgi:hypothetical protein
MEVCIVKRFFFYQYNNDNNFSISVRKGLFGCRDTEDGLPTKFKKLCPGDIIIIRNNSDKSRLVFYGYGEVVGKPFDERENSIQNGLIWEDEKKAGSVIYPYRVSVNFNPEIKLINLHRLDWGDFEKLRWKNKKMGVPLDKKGLASFFKGNFVEEDTRFTAKDMRELEALLGVNEQTADFALPASDIGEISAANRVGVTTLRIIRDTRLSITVKELHEYKCQICGHSLEFPDGKRYAEAHHIKPLGIPHNGPDCIENIICVCPNHHAELDYGMIRLGTSALVSHKHRIGVEYIDYHNKNIYTGTL